MLMSKGEERRRREQQGASSEGAESILGKESDWTAGDPGQQQCGHHRAHPGRPCLQDCRSHSQTRGLPTAKFKFYSINKELTSNG